MQANINHGLIVQYPGPRIYNEPQGMNLTKQNGASSSLLKKTFWIVLKGTLMSMMTKYITCILYSVYVLILKVRKSQKQFFLKLHCPKSDRNILKDFCAGAELLQKFSVTFWAIELLEKCLLRFPDLYVPTYVCTNFSNILRMNGDIFGPTV